MTPRTIPVMAAQMIDPGQNRISFDAPEGSSVYDTVERAVGVASVPENRIRVTLVSDTKQSVVGPHLWAHVFPKPGIAVVIRTMPGGENTRSVLLAVVSIAALALTPAVAGLLGVSGTFALGLVTAGLTIVGTLLVNALIPAPGIEDPEKARNIFAINGWQNEVRPGAPVPCVFGKHRYAPPFAATSWTEVVGDDQYVRALFTGGYGSLRISDMRIGETPIEDLNNVDVEIREGRADDGPVSLYPRQVIEDAEGVELVRPLPLDELGEVIEDADTIETPITRFTASDSSEASIILGFPGGLFYVDDAGDLRTKLVSVRIRMRLNGEGPWTTVETLQIRSDKRKAMLRQHTWSFPTRGRWQIEITRKTPETTNAQVSDLVTLQAIQSIRPEYPVNFAKPLSLIAVRIKATAQLNGPLDNLNVMIEREGPVYDAVAGWTTGYGSNPATAYLLALTGPQNPYPVVEAEIDMEQIADWFAWCALKGLRYDRVHDQSESLGDMLAAICAAGRATPRHDGVHWGVVIDRPQEIVVEHINPRNSDQFTWERAYFDHPDGFRVPFLDATNDYRPAERIVPWPGHVGDVENAEQLPLPGKTDPDEIWREARRRMHELMHRPDLFHAMVDGASRVMTRGDLIMANSDVLESMHTAARVKSVIGSLIEIDEMVEVGAGFGVRFRTYANAGDQIGASLVRMVAATDGPSRALRLLGSGPMPSVGEAIHLGPAASESRALRVRGVEAAEDFSSRLIMVADAPEIDVLTDAEVPPAWDGRIGVEVATTVLVPAAPLIYRISSGALSTGVSYGLEVLLAPSSGSPATVTSYEVDHRLTGAAAWTTITVPAASASLLIEDYAKDDVVEIRARAVATGLSANTSIVTHTIGTADPDAPAAIDPDGVNALGSMGRAVLGVSIAASSTAKTAQIYRVADGEVLNAGADKIQTPIAVTAGSTTSFVDGDATRTTILSGGSFNSAAGWNTSPGWTIANDEATHTPGTGGTISKVIATTAGKAYRIAVQISGHTAGTITPQLLGGAGVSGAATSENGLLLVTMTAIAATTDIGFAASATFDGTIDDVIVFQETPSCAPSGDWNYWIEPINSAGVSGPFAGPFAVTIF